VVEGDDGVDARLGERVEEDAVERDTLGVEVAAAAGVDARPGDREPVRLKSELLHQRQVLAPPEVMVRSDVAWRSVPGPAGGVGEGGPDRGAAAAHTGRPLDLVGGRRGPPDERVGESALCHRTSLPWRMTRTGCRSASVMSRSAQ